MVISPISKGFRSIVRPEISDIRHAYMYTIQGDRILGESKNDSHFNPIHRKAPSTTGIM
jgi:hypothetical protein